MENIYFDDGSRYATPLLSHSFDVETLYKPGTIHIRPLDDSSLATGHAV